MVRGLIKRVKAKKWRNIITESYYLIYTMLYHLDFGYVSREELKIPIEKGFWHEAINGPDLCRVLRTLCIKDTDSILDLGCGKRSALLNFAKFHFNRIDGVDISPELISTARYNLLRMRCNRPLLFCSDAEEFKSLDIYNYFYIYNSFPDNVMKNVILNIEKSLQRQPRLVTLIYAAPLFHNTIVNSGTFQLVKEFNHSLDLILIYQNLSQK